VQPRAPGSCVSVVGAQSAPRTTAAPELTCVRSRTTPAQETDRLSHPHNGYQVCDLGSSVLWVYSLVSRNCLGVNLSPY